MGATERADGVATHPPGIARQRGAGSSPPSHGALAHLSHRLRGVIKVEFTIEPFEEGDPPQRVTRAVAAVEALGVPVEIGVFGSSFTTSASQVGEALNALVTAAYELGATHITIDTEVVG